ncbi:LamB/YcsF family protein [Fusobacterium sp. PH5-44]|uniref:LamB/YcsF family protein n=1 Tax=unclassified Fusobacterium TaxID=2648384 RepID=UPI003D213841
MLCVDLNSDLGESFGLYTIGMDSEVLKYISSANVACGWHAGDAVVMEKTVKMAKANNTKVGAHPGFKDLEGFGRRNLAVTPQEMKAYVKYQIGALIAIAKAEGVALQHVKPHGAMYNMAAKDYKLALAIAEAIKEVDDQLIFMGLANSEMIRAGKDIGLRVCNEVFADRAYNDDGTLVARSIPGSVIHDKDIAIQRVIKMVKEGKVTSVNGKEVEINAESICIHGDNPEALNFSKNIKEALEKEGVTIKSLI